MSGSAAPRVLLSRSALARNAKALNVRGRVVDLRHDAYGHGLDEAARIVVDAGASRILTGTGDEAARLRDAGVPAQADALVPATASDLTAASALFGIPDAATPADALPVMMLEGRVLAVKPLLKGEAVSYGYTHRASRDTRIALVTGGYAQGIVRALGNRAHVQIGERTHPVIGRIAMDVCVVDLEDVHAEVGDPVTYFGGTGSVRRGLAEWADATGLSALEMAVVIGRSTERSWVA
ncbi:alanine racemase C-terminal domain-containing protein [Microbacterium soli]|uniref:Alanine racemase C-terminal domain-containing protein n=1 Tax=Microbacterium soli TaxID=446075 RepID=A0ABP7NJH3_9MICO